MSFAIRQDRPIPRELRRVVAKEFRRLQRRLSDRPLTLDRVHEVRTRLKKIRSIMHLLRQPLGRRGRKADDRLAEAAHALAPLRDADAAVETMSKLGAQHATVLKPALLRVAMRALTRRRRHDAASSAPVARRARKRVSKAQGPLRSHIDDAVDADTIRNGLVDGYRRARGAMGGLDPTADATAFHAWRRRVKDHRLHLRLLLAHPAAMRRVERLHLLEKWLGEEHNLTMLADAIERRPTDFGTAATSAVILQCIAKSQQSLRLRALTLGRRLFADKPRAFRSRINGWLVA